MENVYGWVAKIGLLAIARETRAMGVTYRDFNKTLSSLPPAT
jgi:hypothetical protein